MSEPIQEMIGRTAPTFLEGTLFPVQPTVDRSRADYEFWSKFRRGKAEGYRLGGLFAPAIGRVKASWVIGDGFTVTAGDDELTNELLQDFITDNIGSIIEWVYDGYTLGDGVLAVNPDASLTQVSPDQLTIETNPLDYRQVDAYTITTIIDQPVNFVRDMLRDDFQQMLTSGQADNRILDSYRFEDGTFKRIVSIRQNNLAPNVMEFPIPINMYPVIHFPNERETNEITGHPTFEHLLYLFARYDTAFNKALDAVEVMGNPLLAVEGLEDPNRSKEANATSTKTVYEEDGTSRTEKYVDVENVQMWWLGKGANMKFVSPNSFTGDTARMLELLFYLMLQSSLIPEWVWGGAIASSRASVDAQMPAFIRSIDYWRSQLKPRLLMVCEAFRRWKALVEPGVDTETPLAIEFPEVVPEDAALMLAKLKLAREEGIITKETTLRKLDIVENPEEEVENADEEAEEARLEFEKSMEDAIDRGTQQQGDEDEETVRSNGRVKEPV